MYGTAQCLHARPLRMQPPWTASGGGAQFHYLVIFPFPGDTEAVEVAVTRASSYGRDVGGGRERLHSALREAGELSNEAGFWEREAADSRELSRASAAEGVG